MARSRFVEPDIVRLNLSDGAYVDIKRRLTAGEERRVMARMVSKLEAGEKPVLDPEQVGRTKIVEYILDWGGFMRGKPGEEKPVAWSEDALDQLHGEDYDEIRKAIDAHEEAEDQKRKAEKNGPAGATNSAQISPSAA